MNELLKDDATVVIDMRNHYEFEVGILRKPLKFLAILLESNCQWL
jgi:predicted sulfurtransferase